MSVIIVVTLLYFIYNIILYIIGTTNIIKKKNNSSKKEIKSLLVIIPAHNEEKVISNLIEDIQKQVLKSSDFKLDIMVILDHCTDGTKDLIIKNKGNTVKYWDRRKGIPGKQNSIKEWINKSQKILDKYDGLVFLDADNRIKDNYIDAITKELEDNEAIQSYLDTLNNENYISKGYTVNYRVMNGVIQRARTLIGLTAFLGGTGWAIRTNTIKKVPFDSTTLIDDAEYTVKLWLNGIKIKYLQDVNVYDEKPIKLKQSYLQRLRWMRGGYQLAIKYFTKVLYSTIKNLRISGLDMLTYISGYAVGFINVILFLYAIIFMKTTFINYFIFQFLFYGFFLIMDCKTPLKNVLWVPYAVLINLMVFPITVHGFITMFNKKWKRTEHKGGEIPQGNT